MGLPTKLKNAWNAFTGRDPTQFTRYVIGNGSSQNPYRYTASRRSEQTAIAALRNRIAVDVASIDIVHCTLDDQGRFLGEVPKSSLNTCFQLEANSDQNAMEFKIDMVESMIEEGAIAVVPVLTSANPDFTDGFSIYSLRVGKILEWMPQHVRVELYDERDGKRKEIIVPKSTTAIIVNPFYSVFNATNSTVQRLLRKLYLLDVVDEQSGAGKLDLIIKLPWLIKSEAKRNEAQRRKQEIEDQLNNSKLGIAYIDGTEEIVQLNRSLENNLLQQVEYLQKLMFSQLGITQEILDGTANDQCMQNYNSRVIEPIISTITLEFKRKFLSVTALGRNHSIEFYRDPFKLVPLNSVAELADKLTRNEITTSNEIRQGLGMKPSKDPKADELRNKNLSEPKNYNQNDYNNYNPINMEEDNDG